MSEYRDRNDKYVPEGLYEPRPRRVAEISSRWDPDTDDRTPILAPVTHGLADELNRDQHWQWADVSGDGSHWARFAGHRVQVDVTFSTSNDREVNDWKGRDEIRAGGSWHVAINRQPCWEGNIGSDIFYALHSIPAIVRKLMDHDAIDWLSPDPAADQLKGRRIYYERTPAVVSSTSVLSQGCVMIQPAEGDTFPASVYDLDRAEDSMDDPSERREHKVELLSQRIWWWREKLVEGEVAQ